MPLSHMFLSMSFGCCHRSLRLRSVTENSMTGIKEKSLREKSNKLTQIKQKDFLKDLIIFDEFHSHNETHRVRM
jgi:hypothetical protein